MNNLLDIAMDAHGGLENWEKIRLLYIDLDIGGNILLTKFKSPLNRHLCRAQLEMYTLHIEGPPRC